MTIMNFKESLTNRCALTQSVKGGEGDEKNDCLHLVANWKQLSSERSESFYHSGEHNNAFQNCVPRKSSELDHSWNRRPFEKDWKLKVKDWNETFERYIP